MNLKELRLGQSHVYGMNLSHPDRVEVQNPDPKWREKGLKPKVSLEHAQRMCLKNGWSMPKVPGISKEAPERVKPAPFGEEKKREVSKEEKQFTGDKEEKPYVKEATKNVPQRKYVDINKNSWVV